MNGERLDDESIEYFEYWSCGQPVSDGDYWFNWDTGAWGYAGGPQEGVLACYGSPSAATEPEQESAPQDEGGASPDWETRMCEQGMCDGVIINPVY